MNVHDFLELPYFKTYQLLAGDLGLTNQITGVNILDNPNALDWLSPGELIVTSGYFFKDNDSNIEKFVRGFDRLNIAALCIKPQIYLTPLPKRLVELCNELAIPLIEIPYGVAFSKILTTVMNLLADESNQKKYIALETSSEFLEHGLKGEGLNKLKVKLETILNKSLVVTNSEWRILTEVTDTNLIPYTKEKNDYLMFDHTKMLNAPISMEKRQHPVTVAFEDNKIGVVLPIFFNEITYGYIIVLYQEGSITQEDYIILKQAAISFAFEIIHESEKAAIDQKKTRDFYRKLLFDNTSKSELENYEIAFNFDLSYSVYLFKIDQGGTNKADWTIQQKYKEDRFFQDILTVVSNYAKSTHNEVHQFKQGKQFIGFFGQIETTHLAKEKQQEKQFNDLYRYLSTYLGKDIKLRLFVGSIQPSDNLIVSYNEAKQMLEYQLLNQEEIVFSNNYYVENFLSRFIERQEAKQFVNRFLESLIEYDQATDSELLNTLMSYLNHHQNLAVTSRQLFIHRNTLLYRIEKIETLLDCDLNEAKNNFNLLLALKMLSIYPDILSE